MKNIKKKLCSGWGLILLAVVFMVVIILSNLGLRGLQWDLTEHKLYTINEGSRNILGQIKEPIELYFYFSERASQNLSSIRQYADRIDDLLKRYEAVSNGKIKLHVIHPEPFSEEEDHAARDGLQSVPSNNQGEELFLGLVGKNKADNKEVIRFFHPDRELLLEYEISKLIYRLVNPKKPVLGLWSSLSINGGIDVVLRQPRPAWLVLEQLRQLFEIREITTTQASIDKDVDVLFIVQPKELTEAQLYAIDQYVLAGGKVVLFVDPHIEAFSGAGDMATQGPTVEINKLLSAWGVRFKIEHVVLDRKYALSVALRAGQPPVSHFALLGLQKDAMNPEDRITAELDHLNMATIGVFDSLPNTDMKVTPLLHSSNDAMLIPSSRVEVLTDPGILMREFTPSGQAYPIAVRISGIAKTAFPKGVTQQDGTKTTPLLTSKGDIHVIAVADVDFLGDRLWARSQDFLGQRLVGAFADNADFVVNAVDHLAGSPDLISIRSRGQYSRPFDRVLTLRAHAEGAFRDKEKQLQDRLRETEQKLAALQTSDTASASSALNPEQTKALVQFQQEKLAIRKELRDVRRELNEAIDRLGNQLKWLNIALVPLLITFVVGAIVGWQRRKRHVIH